MTRALFRRVVVGDAGDAALQEITRSKIKLWRNIAADYENATLRKSKLFHVRDDALEKRNRLAAAVGHRNKRLAYCSVRRKALRVAAGMAD